MLAGFDDDLAVEATRLTNRIRGLPVDVHPALEPAIGPYLDKTVGPDTRSLLAARAETVLVRPLHHPGCNR